MSLLERLQNDVCYAEGEELHCPFMALPGEGAGAGADDIDLLAQLQFAHVPAPAPADMEDLATMFSDRFCSVDSDAMDAALQPLLVPALDAQLHVAQAQTEQQQRQQAMRAKAVVKRPNVVRRTLPAGKKGKAVPSPPAQPSPAQPVPQSAFTQERDDDNDDNDSLCSQPLSPSALFSTAPHSRAESPSPFSDDPVLVQKRRNCEASARYRKKKQNELETLRQQYLELFGQNKKLQKRLGALEAQNQELLQRAELAESRLAELSRAVGVGRGEHGHG